MLGSACSEAPADGECAKLFAHMVDLEAAASGASDTDATKHKAAMNASERDDFVERCERNIKAVQVSCSLKAQTLEEFEACDTKAS